MVHASSILAGGTVRHRFHTHQQKEWTDNGNPPMPYKFLIRWYNRYMSGIIVDIDGTLLSGDRGIQHTIDYINSQASRYDIFIITGRPESERAKTVAALKENGVHYNRLFMNPSSSSVTLDHKKETAQRLLSKQRIVLAIDNNSKMLAMYRNLGIKSVMPSRIPTAK